MVSILGQSTRPCILSLLNLILLGLPHFSDLSRFGRILSLSAFTIPANFCIIYRYDYLLPTYYLWKVRESKSCDGLLETSLQIFLFLIFLVKYSWYTILYSFQVYIIVILQCDHHTKSSNHMSPCKLITMLVTIFPFSLSPISSTPSPLATTSLISSLQT